MNATNAPLRVFLCHASIDKLQVRKLYHFLRRRGIKPWMASEDLLPGRDWEEEVQKEIAASDAIIICLTKNSTGKEGYFQKEVKLALERAKEMPESQIFIIPAKLEDCEIPRDLTRYQYWDLTAEKNNAKLLKSLELRAVQLGRMPVKSSTPGPKEDKLSEKSSISKERVLEAAIQNQVFVGKPASLFVWVRRRGSENLISVVQSIDEDVRLDEANIKARELRIDFPIENGKPLPAEITLRLSAPEFKPSPQQKKINIPPNGDSEVCVFDVTPKTTGELVLTLEVLEGEFSAASKQLRTIAIDQEMKVANRVVLMVIPIFVLVQSHPTLPDVKPLSQKEEKPVEIQTDGDTPDQLAPDESGQMGKDGKNKDHQPTNSFPWAAVIGSLAVLLAAYIGFLGNRAQAMIPIEATQTAEALLLTRTAQVVLDTDTPQPTITIIPTVTSTLTFTPTQFVCPYQGQTDDQTIVGLIQAEATAANSGSYDIIRTIFDPDAIFIDYAPTPPNQWNGPQERYQLDLFQTTEFQNVEHFEILPAGPGIVGDTAYYTSGSRGQYRSIGGVVFRSFNNGSARTTTYGSEHWILRKNDKGCWVITKLEFDAGHIDFP